MGDGTDRAGGPDAEPGPERRRRIGTLMRGLAIDITPLRRSRDYRVMWTGQLIGLTGRQITAVALPFQVFLLTRSSLAVGLIGLAQIVPLVAVGIGTGPLADRVDRRRLIVLSELGLALTSLLLLAGALWGRPPLWYLYVLAGAQAGLSGISGPARSASIPNLVAREQLPAAMALTQVLFNTSMIVGPALAGLILARYGLTWAYGAELASCVGSIAAALMLRPLPPKREEGSEVPSGWLAIREGFSFLRGRRVLLSTFAIDLNAMVFGMPRALFPVLALQVFRVGPEGLGLLYAAPSVGALLGALTTGWVGRIRRQGRAVVWAVAVWGLAITAFGLSGRFFGLALVCLAIAGAADVISAVFRGTILQLSLPDTLRGRISGIHIMVVTGGPRLGDVEAGLVASLVSPWFSVVSGGIACVAGAAILAATVPEFLGYSARDERLLEQ
ncbi:MAG: MFS transporter [Actinobacteria bacterium]|nr:MFS transporter [Actinomycetota bacterium]